MPLRIFASALCLLLATLNAQTVEAQSGQALSITVTPEVAEPGVVRTIRVSGSWPDGCSAPSFAGSPPPSSSPTGGVSLILGLAVFSPCVPAGRDFSSTTTYTPTVAGAETLTLLVRVGALVRDGRTYDQYVYITQGKLITRPVNGARAGADITGAWHDPATPGHGFSLYHAQSGSDVMAGAWYAYDSTGKPHWLLLNNVRWNDAARFIGDLFDIASVAGGCPLNLAACARSQSASTQVGRITGELLTDGKLRIVITAGPPFADPPFPRTLTLERLSF